MFLLQEGLNENTDPTSLKGRHTLGDILREKAPSCARIGHRKENIFAPFFYFVTD